MLTKEIESYLALRRKAGFELKDPEKILHNFSKHASEKNENYVKKQTAIEWASLAPSPGQRRRKLHTLMRFVRHARSENKQHEIFPLDIFGSRPKRPIPYIYSSDEISRLLCEASKLGTKGSFLSHKYTTLFGLLACTGIRISEALSLRLNDITPEGIHINQTKFKKSRFIPIHKTVFDKLQDYIIHREQFALDDDHLFISIHKTGLSYNAVHDMFQHLRKQIDLDKGPSRSRPRIHDLRHTFAVRSLERCPEGRDNVGKHTLALSTYLGHAHVSDTYWYLEATPQLMTDISEAAENYMLGGDQS